MTTKYPKKITPNDLSPILQELFTSLIMLGFSIKHTYIGIDVNNIDPSLATTRISKVTALDSKYLIITDKFQQMIINESANYIQYTNHTSDEYDDKQILHKIPLGKNSLTDIIKLMDKYHAR